MLDTNEMVVMYYFRVLKEALRSSGANCTEKHMEELSMCSLLLLDVAKRSDHEFDTPYRSSRHTIRSADDDIKKMVKYLIEEKVTHALPGCPPPGLKMRSAKQFPPRLINCGLGRHKN